MIENYRKLWALLDSRERRNALLLLGLMMLMGIFEVVGVASIMPFIAVISNTEIIHSNQYLAWCYDYFGFTDDKSFLLFLGSAVFFTIVVSLTIKATTNWAMARFSHMRSFSLSSRMLKSYLRKPYSWFLSNHTADLGKTVLSEVQEVVSQSLIPSVYLIANLIVASLLVGLLVAVDPLVAFSSLLILGGAYVMIYALFRKYLNRIGADRVDANRHRFQIAQEAFGGIKEVKMYNLEAAYVRGFRSPARKFAHSQANNQVIGRVPRYILEAIAFGGILVVLMMQIEGRGEQIAEVIPLISLYAFAGYRLMPALQQLYQSTTKLRFGKPALDNFHHHLSRQVPAESEVAPPTIGESIAVNESIVLDEISYTYPGAERAALVDFSLSIPARNTVAIVGPTGSGKTTAVDLLLGLLRPEKGKVCVDDLEITDNNLRSWQRSLGYVPQSIFLFDDTVARNIAFGVSESKIDMAAVENAARLAELHEFVTVDLTSGYDTMVGERGVRLSGGQRQRIGIARALYHDPDTLILDEATSALDNLTEKAVMDAVHNLSHKKTIVMIAHRMSTVRECDILFLLDRGKVVAEGSYDELLASSEQFQAIVNG